MGITRSHFLISIALILLCIIFIISYKNTEQIETFVWWHQWYMERLLNNPHHHSTNIDGYIKYTGQFIPDESLQAGSGSPIQLPHNHYLIGAVNRGRNECSRDSGCAGFMAYLVGNMPYYRLIRFDFRSIGSIIKPYTSSGGIRNMILYVKQSEIYRGPYMSNIQTFVVSSPSMKSEKPKVSDQSPSQPPKIETFVSPSSVVTDQVIPVSSPLSLTIFADDAVEIWRYNNTSKKSELYETARLGQPFQMTENKRRMPIRNTLVSKMIIPDFTNDDALVFRLINTGGPGYFIANWEWNGKQFGTDPSTLKIPAISLVQTDRLSSNSVQSQFVTTGEYQGCYRDTDSNIPVLTRSLGHVRSLEECAVMAYGRMRDENTSSDYYYGLRNRICYVGSRLGCSGGAVKPTTDNECNWLMRGGFGETSGRGNTTAVYKISNKNMQYLPTPIETIPLNNIPPSQYNSIRNNIDFTRAKPIKVKIQNTNKWTTDMGFPTGSQGTRYDRRGNPIGFGRNTIGYREFVWTPDPEYKIKTRVLVCGNPESSEFSSSMFYDPENATSAKNTLRYSFYEISDEACGTDGNVTKNNIIDKTKQETVVNEIMRAIDLAITTSSHSDWEYASNVKHMIRIDDDAKVHCIANNTDARECAIFGNKPQGKVDSTRTLRCNNYTSGSWCIMALNNVYSGSENLRFVGKFKARVVELLTLLNAYTDFKKNLDDTVNLDEYLDMTNLDSLIDENDWSKMDEFKRRINNALDKVYELNGRNLINRNEVIVMTKMDNKKSTVVNVVYDLYKYAQIINDASRI